MTEPPLDCLCAGILVADHVCQPIDRLPDPGELVLTPGMSLSIGGCAANVAVDLARLGRRIEIAGAIGDDIFGEFLARSLQQARVGTDGLTMVSSCDTAGTLVVNAVGQDRRFIHSLGASTRFTGAEVDLNLLKSARVLYLGGYLLWPELTAANVRQLFESAREHGVKTVLDVVLSGPGDYRAPLETVLPLTDVFLPNTDEATLLTGLNDAEQQAVHLRQLGAGTVTITCGAEGAVTAHSGGVLRTGCFPVEVADGTGSGDAAGFRRCRFSPSPGRSGDSESPCSTGIPSVRASTRDRPPRSTGSRRLPAASRSGPAVPELASAAAATEPEPASDPPAGRTAVATVSACCRENPISSVASISSVQAAVSTAAVPPRFAAVSGTDPRITIDGDTATPAGRPATSGVRALPSGLLVLPAFHRRGRPRCISRV